MKKFLSLFGLISASALLLSSCEETPPYINLTPSNSFVDTTYITNNVPAAQAPNVLIEEFTGVRCPNCPAAQTEAKNIAANNPGRINIMTIHPLGLLNSLTTPFSVDIGDKHTSKYDFRTLAGKEIFSMVGVTSQLPRGDVNRRLFSAESERAIDYPKWANYVAQELAKNTPVNIDLKSYITANDSIAVEVTLTYTEAVSDSNYLTLAVLEDGMEDVQEKNEGGTTIYVEDYEHEHVLRAVITDYYGDLLKAELVRGRVFKKLYLYKRDEKWVKQNLSILALVNSNTTKKDVIHSMSVKIK
ncbi:MAG: Omp28-related outer membrane protein [Bacteroidetes bacterium]|nr:Omp28-related outer membrane protein [Bacteroidota bacterium]